MPFVSRERPIRQDIAFLYSLCEKGVQSRRVDEIGTTTFAHLRQRRALSRTLMVEIGSVILENATQLRFVEHDLIPRHSCRICTPWKTFFPCAIYCCYPL